MKIRKTTSKGSFNALIGKIKADVQAFAVNMAGLSMATNRLAPLVAAAFKQFKEANVKAKKLDFMKLFATKEQLSAWPATDADAKTPGSPVQSLFNSIEYLIRRAGQLAAPATVPGTKTRISRDEVAGIVVEGWKSDLDDFETYTQFCAELLGLKYSEKTVTGIIDKATAVIVPAAAVEEPATVPPPVEEGQPGSLHHFRKAA